MMAIIQTLKPPDRQVMLLYLEDFDAREIADVTGLGSPGKIPLTTEASGIAKAIAMASYAMIDDASPYSMFGVCNPDAAALAESEQLEDPICEDGGGRPRSQLHAQLIDLTRAAFSHALKTEP